MSVQLEPPGLATCYSDLCSNPSFQGLHPTLAAFRGGGGWPSAPRTCEHFDSVLEYIDRVNGEKFWHYFIS